MERITDDVYRVEMPRPDLTPPWKPQTKEPVGCHLFEGDRRILFGTGYGFSADRLIDDIESFGGIDVVVAEHGDPDHFGAIPALLEHFDDLLVAIPTDDAAVLDKYYFDLVPDLTLDDGDEHWGLRAVHVPGHTPGNMAFVDESRGLVFGGDTFVNSESELAADGDWSGALAPIVSRYNKAATADARANVRRLAEYDFEIVLLTHGADVERDGRGHLDALMADLDLD